MKFIISLLSLVNGLYMLIDGVYVMFKGKFIGPEIPGPWSVLFIKLNIDVFKLGPLFISFGAFWLLFLIAFFTNQPWAHVAGEFLAICTLWYLPLGTIISALIFFLLIYAKK